MKKHDYEKAIKELRQDVKEIQEWIKQTEKTKGVVRKKLEKLGGEMYGKQRTGKA